MGNQRRMTSGVIRLLTNTLFSAAGDTVNLAAAAVMVAEYESRRVQRTRRTMDVLFIMMEKMDNNLFCG